MAERIKWINQLMMPKSTNAIKYGKLNKKSKQKFFLKKNDWEKIVQKCRTCMIRKGMGKYDKLRIK